MSKLSKTDYISYRECPHNVWVKWHNQKEYDKHELSDFEKSLIEAGIGVEELARNKFPNGFLIEKRSAGAEELTKKLIDEKTPVIFQAVFSTDRFLAAADVLKWNSIAQAYDIYEIKMSNSEEEDENGNLKKNKKKEEQFEHDLAFQTIVIEASGVKLNKKYLVRLNRKYVRQGELNFDELFLEEDKSPVEEGLREQVCLEMEEAYKFLSIEKMPPPPCVCYYKGRSSHCTTFSYINPNVPEYSIHDLNRIGNSKKFLEELLDEGILAMDDVEIDDRLKGAKLNQVIAHKKGSPVVDLDKIKEELENLTFPLYFLDYETYPTAIPPFNGYTPFQHIVFQYSLHVLDSAESEPKHFECLILQGDPSKKIAESLREHIDEKGTIVSWHKAFENSRNKELAKLVPEHSKFLLRLIDRTYDLKDIVEKQYFVHPEFRGKSSIKKVLPVLVPELSYSNLGVKSGTDAIESYRQISAGEITSNELENRKQEMLEYCKLDTYAMYKIWKAFSNLIAEN